jgi:23S rRNA pseudouridine1911/1915/1917 synthase
VIETIPGALAGERIDRVVALLTGFSRAEAADLVASGAVRLSGRPITSRSTRVDEGDEVEVDTAARVAGPVVEADPTVVVPVVHEDADVVVVDKPAGLVVHPGAGRPHGTLVNGLLARYPELATVGDPVRPGLVHRLDKETSGLLVVARTEGAREALLAQLARREMSRRYLALVWGRFDAARGTIDAPIGRSTRRPTSMAVSARGKEARTRYEVVQAFDEPAPVTLLACNLETGRTHQIRVHLAAVGHPVVGDRRYGGARSTLAVPRFFLHAAHLGFTHPRTGERLEIDSELPDDLEQVLAGVR